MAEETHPFRFYGFEVKHDECSGPSGNFHPPQEIISRSGEMRKDIEGAKTLKHLIPFDKITIVACPQLNGTICSRSEEKLHCIKPHPMSNPAKLAAEKLETTITLRSSGGDILIVK